MNTRKFRTRLGAEPEPVHAMNYVIGWLEDIFGKGRVNAVVTGRGRERVVWVRGRGADERYEGRGSTWREAATACIEDMEKALDSLGPRAVP